MHSQPDTAAEFIALLSQCERRLAGYVLALVPSVPDADEILQETKIQLWSEFEKYDRSRPFDSWALTIAYYQVLTYRKRCSRNKLVFSSDLVELLSDEFSQHESSGRAEALRKCLEKLNAKSKRIVLDYYSGVSVARLSDTCGMSSDAIRKLIYRSRLSLQECIDRALSLGRKGGA